MFVLWQETNLELVENLCKSILEVGETIIEPRLVNVILIHWSIA